MKKALILNSIILFFALVHPVFADSGDVTKVESFIKSITSILVTIATVVAVTFIVIGGIGYITSTGNPERLDRSKQTIFFSVIGLAIAIGALVLTNIVQGVATTAFGSSGQ